MTTDLHKKFLKGLNSRNLSERDLENYNYVGSDQSDPSGYKKFLQHFPHGITPEHEDNCVCGHDIHKNYYLYNKIDDKFLVIGSECINQFTEGKKTHCIICNDIHNRHSDNICFNCNELNKKFLSKNKTIIDICENYDLIDQNEKDIWNLYHRFRVKNQLEISNYENLIVIFNIYLKAFKILCPVDCDYRTNILDKYDIKNIFNNHKIINRSIISNNLKIPLNIIEKYLYSYFINYINHKLKLFIYEDDDDNEKYTLIPEYLNLDEYRIDNGFIYFSKFEEEIYTCNICNKNFYYINNSKKKQINDNLNFCKKKNICLKCHCKKINDYDYYIHISKYIEQIKIKKDKHHVNCVKCNKVVKFNLKKKIPLADFICKECKF